MIEHPYIDGLKVGDPAPDGTGKKMICHSVIATKDGGVLKAMVKCLELAQAAHHNNYVVRPLSDCRVSIFSW